MKIDRNKFTAEELRQYEKLIAKALVQDDPDEDEQSKAPENDKENKKPLPELAEALKRLDRLEKIIERSKLSSIARKYSMLGEDEEELTNTLGKLKKSDEASYNAYISVLDKSLDLVQKSGLFTEIGKSGIGVAGCSALDKIQSAASELQKADPKLDRTSAIAKAWDNHPELAYEYDMEYRMRGV